MSIREDFLAAIGNTPLIKLRKASELTACTILGKAEFLNPGGSVKDRAAKYIVLDGERKGLIEPGGLIVEGTAGNTGIGLALVGNARGYRTLILMPQTQTQEKQDPNNYVHIAERTAEELKASEQHGVLYANQWDNLANREAHLEGTGPEIWEQTGGKVDGFICAVGTGGTLSGVGSFLKQKDPNIVIAAADPMGAAIYSWIKTGELASSGTSITEGIGQGRVTGNLAVAEIDDAYQIPDTEMLPIIFDLLQHEGLLMGGSTGINVAGAIRLAKDLGPGKTIVTALCDSGARYHSKLFNPAFLKEKGLPPPPWLV
jgi:cysteine synthase A